MMNNENFIAFLAGAGVATAVFLLGILQMNASHDKRCVEGHPVVINNEVYRCEKVKS